MAPRSHVRFGIVSALFIMTALNYADRATISIAGPAMAKDLGFGAVTMGYIFSAFGWAYVIGQLPGGWLLDRFGARRVYADASLIRAAFTSLQGLVVYVSASAAVRVLFVLRMMVGLAEAPAFPGNSRIVAAWFPTAERGTASAIFNSAQYFATVLFAPLMGWITFAFGWRYVFWVMGALGFLSVALWLKVVYEPAEHPRINQAEFEYIKNGGALVDAGCNTARRGQSVQWRQVKQLLGSRMLIGVYFGQYCINAVTYFFLTWFPAYLVQARGISILKAGLLASAPAVCGFAGGILGGMASDYLLNRGCSLTLARKAPIVAGMLMSAAMIVCNYVNVEALVVGIMGLSFFGKGFGALGWAVVSDTSPKEMAGFAGGMFNFVGSISAVTTPIVIGYIVQRTGSFNNALVFVSANALGTVLSYLLIVGEIKRMELKPGC
jgi:ACS family glucarate transporter-like MFS transporter